jgi:ASC-1-like (ASCH) protein
MEAQAKEWNMPLFQWAYEAIDSQKKTIEGRVPDFTRPEKDYRAMKSGDVLKFYVVNANDGSRVQSFPDMRLSVSFVHHYPTIEEMLQTEGVEKMVPQAKSIDEAVQVYLGFPGIPERVPKYGIYAIGLGERFL